MKSVIAIFVEIALNLLLWMNPANYEDIVEKI